MPAPWVAGVASGLAVHLRADVALIRLLFIIFSILGGSGILSYLLLAVFIPSDGADPTLTPARGATPLANVGKDQRLHLGRRQVLSIGVGFLLLAALFALTLSTTNLEPTHLVAGILTLAGLWLTWLQGNAVAKWQTIGFWLRLGGGMLLLLLGVFVFLSHTLSTGYLLRGIIYGAGIVLLILVALAPIAITVFKQMTASQEREIREAERATIAAHLHDSVLQTLTLIRGAADNPAKVRALALGQERELRAWLYTGTQQVASSTAQALREAIASIESTYGVAIDVVTVGDAPPDANELAIVAAAAEASTNAARHGAAPITVYMEITPARTEIFIKDRGRGFDLAAIPSDRHGVRGSIIGRVERVGGSAQIRRVNPGTEVHLTVPRTPSASEQRH